MIRHKLNPNQRLTLGLTPTPLMRVLHDTELMKAFLDIGADPNAQDKDGNTALHLATRVITFRSNENLNLEADLLGVAYFQVTDTETRARTIELLLRYGAKPDALNHAGMTPLMLTMVDDAKIINLLLNAGAKTININAGTPKILRQYNISIGPVSWALLQGNETLATQWIQKFGTVQDSDCGAVYYAARGGSATTLNALLDANAPRTVSENSGETPLIGAAMAGHVSTVKLLLDRGAADINEGTRVPDIKSKQMGAASLDYAAAHNSLGGVTPLMAAIKAKKTEVVKLLIDRGADLSRRDKLGQTALDYAKGARNSEILTLMKSAGVESKEISREEIKEQQDFADSIAIKIQKSLGEGIKDFSLSPGTDSNPVLPGDDSSVEMVECEKRSIFTIYDYASEQGRIAVSVCNKNAQRARDLAIHASQTTSTALKDIGIPELSEVQIRKAGWYAVHKTLSDGADFYYFPMIFVGHGIFTTQTAVLYNKKSADAVVIQFSSYPMCESDAYKNAPACKNIDETLESLAVAVKK
jgi:ankyrin repeat protein